MSLYVYPNPRNVQHREWPMSAIGSGWWWRVHVGSLAVTQGPSGRDIDGEALGSTEGIWEISIPSSQFFCKSKTTLKKKKNLKKTVNLKAVLKKKKR